MGNWDSYQREEREAPSNITGKLRCVIVSAEEKVSKSGNPMIEIKVRPSGCKFSVTTWLVKNEYFNRNATRFFDTFPEITDGDFNLLTWVGAEGAADFGPDDNGYLKVKGWVFPRQAESLPPFKGEKPERQTLTTLDDDSGLDDEMPF